MGVDTEHDEETAGIAGGETLNNILKGIWYKGKAMITGTLLKQVTIRVTTYV